MFHVIKDERSESKMEGKFFFFEAPETVSRLDLADSDPPYLTTDLRHCATARECHSEDRFRV